jgi:hypothetical protein
MRISVFVTVIGKMTHTIVLRRLFAPRLQLRYNFARNHSSKCGRSIDVAQSDGHCFNRFLSTHDRPVIREDQLVFLRFFRVGPVA